MPKITHKKGAELSDHLTYIQLLKKNYASQSVISYPLHDHFPCLTSFTEEGKLSVAAEYITALGG
jgi:hypothetical protein